MHFGAHMVQTSWPSPLGVVHLAASDKGLAGIWFEGDRHRPAMQPWALAADHPRLRQAIAQLDAYFAGRATDFDLPLDLGSGTPFQQSVWRALLELPHGRTTSYGALSAHIGRPRAVRAVGAAIGRNPLSIVVPCHRVLGAGGALTGYAGGLERKAALLRLEGVLAA